jgi:hypothetical protein
MNTLIFKLLLKYFVYNNFSMCNKLFFNIAFLVYVAKTKPFVEQLLHPCNKKRQIENIIVYVRKKTSFISERGFFHTKYFYL